MEIEWDFFASLLGKFRGTGNVIVSDAKTCDELGNKKRDVCEWDGNGLISEVVKGGGSPSDEFFERCEGYYVEMTNDLSEKFDVGGEMKEPITVGVLCKAKLAKYYGDEWVCRSSYDNGVKSGKTKACYLGFGKGFFKPLSPE